MTEIVVGAYGLQRVSNGHLAASCRLASQLVSKSLFSVEGSKAQRGNDRVLERLQTTATYLVYPEY